MRWEYCTKMTFQKSGYSEWHSWATYRYRDYFDRLYTNYLMETKSTDPEKMDPTKHILTIDLAIYDEVQWQKMMQDVELVTSHAVLNAIEDKELRESMQDKMPRPMSCGERLSHAIQIDKIKIYPNASSVIESRKRRSILETHDERVNSKHNTNEYHNFYQNKEEQAHFDDPEMHDAMVNSHDQTWYYVLADCHGQLEIFKDDQTKREHLLGLNALYEDLNSDMLYQDSLREEGLLDIPELNQKPKKGMRFNVNMDSDSFEETNLINENHMMEDNQRGRTPTK